MAELTVIRCSGGLEFITERSLARPGLSGRVESLFCFLLCQEGRPVMRDQVMEQVWETDQISRRSAVSTGLWRLRDKIASIAGLNIETDGDRMRLEVGAEVDVDFLRLKAAVRAAETAALCDPAGLAGVAPEAMMALRDITDATGNPFFQTIEAAWAHTAREELRELRLQGLELLMKWYVSRGWRSPAIRTGRALLAQDAYRENILRDVMWQQFLNGQRVEAMTQYHRFKALLSQELGICPMEETETTFKVIEGGRAPEGEESREDLLAQYGASRSTALGASPRASAGVAYPGRQKVS